MDAVEDFRARMGVVTLGLFVVIGLLALLIPRSPPPARTWADGLYVNPCCAPVVLRDGVISSGRARSRYTVADGKLGYYLDVPAGVGVRNGAVTFGGTMTFVYFNKVSELEPAVHDARSLHLGGMDDARDYEFVRRPG